MDPSDQSATVPLDASDEERRNYYLQTQQRISFLVEGEKDLTACLATVACELHHTFEYYHWTVCSSKRGFVLERQKKGKNTFLLCLNTRARKSIHPLFLYLSSSCPLVPVV